MAMTDSERVTIRLPNSLLQKLEELVEQGRYHNKSDAIRAAIELFLSTEITPPHVEKFTLEVPKANVSKLQELVNAGDSLSVADAIRDAIKEYTKLRVQKMVEEYEEIRKIKGLDEEE